MFTYLDTYYALARIHIKELLMPATIMIMSFLA